MSKRSDADLISDIKEAIGRIAEYLGEMSYGDFLEDIKTQDAIIRNIEVIGEAAKGVTDRVRSSSSEIPWKSIAAMRDRLIHQYFGVNLEIVWQVVSHDLRELEPHFSSLLREIPSGDHD